MRATRDGHETGGMTTDPRHRPWLPFLALLVQLAVVAVGSGFIDGSGLEQGIDSWGYLLGVVLAIVFYATWPVLITLLCAVVGAVATSATGRRVARVVGATTAAAWALLGLVVGAVTAVTASVEADVAFGALLVLASLVPLVPLGRVIRERRASA